jgi:hypothetical protein
MLQVQAWAKSFFWNVPKLNLEQIILKITLGNAASLGAGLSYVPYLFSLLTFLPYLMLLLYQGNNEVPWISTLCICLELLHFLLQHTPPCLWCL